MCFFVLSECLTQLITTRTTTVEVYERPSLPVKKYGILYFRILKLRKIKMGKINILLNNKRKKMTTATSMKKKEETSKVFT